MAAPALKERVAELVGIGHQRFDAQGVLATGRDRAASIDNVEGISHILDRGGS
jgi:hypothetical protein